MKIDRLIGIISILLQKDKVTAPFLAKKFEVSRRTINRDIETITQSGIPLVTEQGQNGGISIMSGYAIDKTAFTSSEMQAILTGLQGLDSISGSKQYQQLMEKLKAGTSDAIPTNEDTTIIPSNEIYINLSSYHKSSLAPKIELFRKAIQNHKTMKFTYFSPKGENERIIDPYILIFWWSSWYVWAYCHLREDFRLFKLNRMAYNSETGETFTPIKEIPSPEYSIQQAYPLQMKVKIAFSKDVKWRLIDAFGVDYEYKEEGDKIIVETYVTDKKSLFSMLLSYGTQAELLEPEDLRNDFASYLKQFSTIYQ
jgi:predicted DNA-binding transcriptional regulator YafY